MMTIETLNNTDEAQLRIRLCREKYSTTLNLSDLGLDHVPGEIKDLKHLRTLILSENHLTALPDFIDTFTGLECLDLSYNKLQTLPQAIGNLASLESLNIRCNGLSELPESIGKLTMLTSLDISYNRLSLLPEAITDLSLLDICNIRGNTFQNLPEKIINLSKPRKLTLYGHMEKIIELTGKSGLSDAFLLTAKTHIEYITQKLHITPIQAVLFSHIVSEYDDSPVHMNEIVNSLNCTKIKLMQYTGDITELENKKLIRSYKDRSGRRGYGRGTVTYRIPQEVSSSIMRDEEFHPILQTNLSVNELFIKLEDLFEQRVGNDEISYGELSDEIIALLNDNQQLKFVKMLKEYHLSNDNMILLLRFCHYYVNIDSDEMNLRQLSEMYDHQSQFTIHKRQLKCGDHILLTKGLIENVNSEGFGDRESFKLSDKTKHELLKELQIKTVQHYKNMISSHTIPEKKLFYNDKESDQICRLTSLLQKDSFGKIQTRLSESGMRTGFVCLFSGSPGTGKTETVYQIARETGRDIMAVDISETKSMWFGESEKRIKEIFTRYKNYVEEAKVTPILLFNEADAIISKRKDVSSGSVSQTENAIQNIILQEFENLKGILIATTNLTENMDKAFERRFLYKIDFKKPCIAARQSIWQSMIESLSVEDAEKLASRYDFSGGQIENIARKRTVEFVLSGIEPSIELLMAFCQDELMAKEPAIKIGFSL